MGRKHEYSQVAQGTMALNSLSASAEQFRMRAGANLPVLLWLTMRFYMFKIGTCSWPGGWHVWPRTSGLPGQFSPGVTMIFVPTAPFCRLFLSAAFRDLSIFTGKRDKCISYFFPASQAGHWDFLFIIIQGSHFFGLNVHKIKSNHF